MLRNLSAPAKVLDAMREDWNRRAKEDAYYYVAFAQRHQSAEAFQSTASNITPILEAELARLPPASNDERRCLEIGCGPGRLMSAMSKHFGEIHGIDVSDAMIGLARDFLRNVTNARVHLSNGADLSLFDKSLFDFVYSFHVFQHIPSKAVIRNYLEETWRILKTGGIFCGQFRGWSPNGPVDTWSGCSFTTEELAESAASYGFQLVSVAGEGTQYTVATLRKAERACEPDPSGITLSEVKALDGSFLVPQRGRGAGVSFWMDGVPDTLDLNDLKIRFDGEKVVRGYYLSPIGPGGACQLNALLPRGLPAGPMRVGLLCRGWPVLETQIEIVAAPPRKPKLVAVTDGENLFQELRSDSGSLKITLEDLEDPRAVRFEVGGESVAPLEYILTDPITDRYWYAIQLPRMLAPGNYALKVKLPRTDLPPVNVRIDRNKYDATLTKHPKRMNVQKVIEEIHARIEDAEDGQPLSARENEELAAFRSIHGRLFDMRNAVGRMPPSPNTFRARISGYLIRAIQRGLFWYTPQIVAFQNELVNALDCTGNLIGWQLERAAAAEKEVQHLRAELARFRRAGTHVEALEKEVHDLRAELHRTKASLPEQFENEIGQLREQTHGESQRTGGATATHSDPLPESFQFALQDRFRGSERETSGKLQPYLSFIEAVKESLPRAPWVDLGCGRGEWLEAATHAGDDAIGVDSNPAAVARCRKKGLNVKQADALSYLQAASSESLGVVTAFHAAEHWPMGYFVALMKEAARALRSNGLLIIETPNPANLWMGTCNFWNDPTHSRPIPPDLLQFIYEYVGLTVVKRLYLNPFPSEERLPYDEIGVVHRLNEYFYGAQDYGIIGRR